MPANHGAHAGWEADVAVSVAVREYATNIWAGFLAGWRFEDAIEDARANNNNDAWKYIDTTEFADAYGDAGHKFCTDDMHTHYGY